MSNISSCLADLNSLQYPSLFNDGNISLFYSLRSLMELSLVTDRLSSSIPLCLGTMNKLNSLTLGEWWVQGGWGRVNMRNNWLILTDQLQGNQLQSAVVLISWKQTIRYGVVKHFLSSVLMSQGSKIWERETEVGRGRLSAFLNKMALPISMLQKIAARPPISLSWMLGSDINSSIYIENPFVTVAHGCKDGKLSTT